MTHKEFAEKDVVFRKACELAISTHNNKSLAPTSRQASKFIRGKGLAIRMKKQAVAALAKEKAAKKGEQE